MTGPTGGAVRVESRLQRPPWNFQVTFDEYPPNSTTYRSFASYAITAASRAAGEAFPELLAPPATQAGTGAAGVVPLAAPGAGPSTEGFTVAVSEAVGEDATPIMSGERRRIRATAPIAATAPHGLLARRAS